MLKIFYQFASLKTFYTLSGKWLPWCWIARLLSATYGLVDGLLIAPPDYQQGNAFRIIYIHVPSAALSLSIYVLIAMFSTIYLVWRIKLADILAKASAPVGIAFTFLALITGAIWGKPMWGTWWIWDARLTSELILLFLYLGIFALRSAILDSDKAAKASGILTLVGLIDIPIIHYSVNWWNTLHQGATLFKFAKPAIDSSMLAPLLAMLISLMFFYVSIVLIRARTEILEREKQTHWIRYSLKQT